MEAPLHLRLSDAFNKYCAKGPQTSSSDRLTRGQLAVRIAQVRSILRNPISFTPNYRGVAGGTCGALLSAVVTIGVPVGAYLLFKPFSRLLDRPLPNRGFSLDHALRWVIYSQSAGVVGLSTVGAGFLTCVFAKIAYDELASGSSQKKEFEKNIRLIVRELNCIKKDMVDENENCDGAIVLHNLAEDLNKLINQS